jgi:hypothetical protein
VGVVMLLVVAWCCDAGDYFLLDAGRMASATATPASTLSATLQHGELTTSLLLCLWS